MKGLKDFLLRGNAVELAVGVIIGAMFGAVVDSLVKGIINPLVAGLVGKPDFDNVGAFALGTATLQPGMVLTSLINFGLKGCVIYFFIVVPMKKAVEKMKAEEPAAPPPGPGAEEKLLTEIRDLLKNKA